MGPGTDITFSASGPLGSITEVEENLDALLTAGSYHLLVRSDAVIDDLSQAEAAIGSFQFATLFAEAPTTPVPEPGSALLVGAGVVGLAALTRFTTRASRRQRLLHAVVDLFEVQKSGPVVGDGLLKQPS
jgi:hypothetical protein